MATLKERTKEVDKQFAKATALLGKQSQAVKTHSELVRRQRAIAQAASAPQSTSHGAFLSNFRARSFPTLPDAVLRELQAEKVQQSKSLDEIRVRMKSVAEKKKLFEETKAQYSSFFSFVSYYDPSLLFAESKLEEVKSKAEAAQKQRIAVEAQLEEQLATQDNCGTNDDAKEAKSDACMLDSSHIDAGGSTDDAEARVSALRATLEEAKRQELQQLMSYGILKASYLLPLYL